MLKELGSFVIIVGALALSFEFGRRGMRFKRNVVALMLGACFLSAVNGVIFKLIAVDKGFWVSLFWGLVGQTMTGLTFLVCVPSYRRDFLDLFKQSKVGAVGLIALSKEDRGCGLFSPARTITFGTQRGGLGSIKLNALPCVWFPTLGGSQVAVFRAEPSPPMR
ncbi:hypothetical protein [Bradyrhizobium sp. 170]|uniref:hypothetical protein n=1 Tax=Bradyrhizobium sp. 170 TaxID=2782641 RepID=UPI001FFFB209|nr:hypothetical protein [Bradyrhizobium sp. 170]UPK06308.1 hypothetical protein IVB05_12665 [Bradyrhizobium sp. 170]